MFGFNSLDEDFEISLEKTEISIGKGRTGLLEVLDTAELLVKALGLTVKADSIGPLVALDIAGTLAVFETNEPASTLEDDKDSLIRTTAVLEITLKLLSSVRLLTTLGD